MSTETYANRSSGVESQGGMAAPNEVGLFEGQAALHAEDERAERAASLAVSSAIEASPILDDNPYSECANEAQRVAKYVSLQAVAKSDGERADNYLQYEAAETAARHTT